MDRARIHLRITGTSTQGRLVLEIFQSNKKIGITSAKIFQSNSKIGVAFTTVRKLNNTTELSTMKSIILQRIFIMEET